MDYHTITTIDTPLKERRAKNIGDIWINAATCNSCGDRIRSKNRHNFVTCSCGSVSVDGGSWYARRAFKDEADFTDEVVTFEEVETSED